MQHGRHLLTVIPVSFAVERGWLAPTLAQSTRTSDKGAGLQTVEELAAGSLVLSEQPYAAVSSLISPLQDNLFILLV